MEEIFKQVLSAINDVVWGPWMLGLLAVTGIYLMLGLRFMPLRKIPKAFIHLWHGRKGSGEGDISGYNALMTSLSATVGTGNIAGVATAIAMGGPGALFWMWCIALVGMATKYAESVLAIRYREVDANGEYVGGPMYYIKNGLSSKWRWMAGTFAFFGMVAGFGIGNTVQANSVAEVLANNYHLDKTLTGFVIAALVGAVLLGGIQRIGAVAGKLVPFMAIAYVGAGLVIILLHITDLPSAIAQIVEAAFNPVSATGGFAGATVWAAIRYGVARGVFSNEAGLGSAPIAHACAQTKHPVDQGLIGMLGTFIDTIIICSITGLVIVLTGAWQSGENGATLSSHAFSLALPGIGQHVVAIGLALFAFTTLLGWSVYSEKCTVYLFGVKYVALFRLFWVLVIPMGAVFSLDNVWLLADTLNAMMALPNLIALLLLSPVVFKLTREFFQQPESRDLD
ncbi:MAG: sodium:alanine symporter family protein [Oceanospirillaceae bacterium]|nr:sodium:alanine symporter family protein [Oceanospirillaceae bacterium]MCP5351117.1 sodium:alanine symporter family protein [Oceanospirillaceae bacterium]